MTVGPQSVEVAWTFVNLSENPYKPKIEKQKLYYEIKGGTIPKVDITVPPKWIYTPSDITTGYIASEVAKYFDFSYKWPTLTKTETITDRRTRKTVK